MKKLSLLLLSFSFCLTFSAYGIDPVYTSYFSKKALSGYDTVAYFTDGKPVKGKDEFKAEYKGAEWLFSSKENLEKFKSNPRDYAPQYGGYCAWKMGVDGGDASTEPEQWTILNGKLYLNYSQGVSQRWLKDPEGFIKKADVFWREKHNFKQLN